MRSNMRVRDMRRLTTPEERALFEKTVRAPHAVKTKTLQEKKSKAQPKSAGLNGNVTRQLQRGATAPESKIDLHGQTLEVAHQSLLAYFRAAQKRHLRLVLVVTGKGRPGVPDTLRNLVPRWLAEPVFARLIAGTFPAHRRHGGEGAFYVNLRKLRP